MFSMMKPVPGGGMPGEFPMSGGPDGPMSGPMGPSGMGPVMNGDGLDGMKSSPANGPGTPRDDGGGMGEYNLGGFGGPPDSDQNESAAILKIKETMQEEAKRFEKEVPPEHSDYYMP